MASTAASGRPPAGVDPAEAVLPTEVALPTARAPALPPRRRVRERLSSAPSSGAPLPSDLVAEASRRLSRAMLVVAAVDFVYVLLFVTVWSRYADTVGRIVGGGALLISVAGAWALRSCPRSQREIVLIGAAYEVVMVFGFSLVEYWHMPDYTDLARTISWACLMIAFFPVLVPGRMLQIASASFAAAAANSLAFVIAFPVRGHPVPELDVSLSLLLPVYLAAALALIPARVVSKLGRQVSQARQLGSYSLVERLGAGGMGEVWRAEHRLLARPAAIKLIKPVARAGGSAVGEDDQEARFIERFEREAQATALLESPHTVELFDFGVEEDGTCYYVMELLRGLDLERLVSRHGPQPPERVAHLLIQVCESLADAHERGMVHRDIKPANVFITSRARAVDYVKVLDFGLVKLVRQEPDDVKLSRAGEVHGTPAYMAPEEAVGEGALDGRANLYSPACVGYWLLTGKLVFDEPSSMKMALAHATRDPIAPSRVAEQVIPPDLEELLMRCLAKRPEERPASAEELGRLLAATGIAEAWTAERARTWWREHLADRLPGTQARLPSRSVQFSIDRAG